MDRQFFDIDSGRLWPIDQWFTANYEAIHQIAADLMRSERPNHTLVATALANEVFLILTTSSLPEKVAAMAVITNIMKHLLIDSARHRAAECRSPKTGTVCPLEDTHEQSNKMQLTAIDIAIANEFWQEFATRHPRTCAVARLRVIHGHCGHEIAILLDMSVDKTRRHWTAAKAYIRRAAELASDKQQFLKAIGYSGDDMSDCER